MLFAVFVDDTLFLSSSQEYINDTLEKLNQKD